MTTLYHGSGYWQEELMPGFKRSGKVVKWDETESNEWLYATPSKEEAIAQGLASLLEKAYQIDHYESNGSVITIVVDGGRMPTRNEILQNVVWLYKIEQRDCDGWEFVGNMFNGIKEEYKTTATIPVTIDDVECIHMGQWMASKTLVIKNKAGRVFDW